MAGNYVIYFSGLFEQGYVRHTWFKKTHKENTIKFKNEQEVLMFATKHKYKWLAKFYCNLYNILSRKRFDFRTYKVIKL